MKSHDTQEACIDMVTLSERGQVVIPAAIREQLNLKAGDKLMVFIKHGQLIGLVPPASFKQWLASMNHQLSQLENSQQEGN